MFIAFEQDAELSNKLIFEVAPNLDQLENFVDKISFLVDQFGQCNNSLSQLAILYYIRNLIADGNLDISRILTNTKIINLCGEVLSFVSEQNEVYAM